MGFFDTERLDEETKQGVFWITRIPVGTSVVVDGSRQMITDMLKDCKADKLDVSALMGNRRIDIRLIAYRVPKKVAEIRLKKLEKEAKKQGKPVTAEKKVMCYWTVLATNLPQELYSAEDVFILYRVRWQVELVFKLWKSEGGLSTSKGKTGDRCLCEFYAKLLGLVISNWLMLIRGGPLCGVSATKMYRQVCRIVPDLAEALYHGDTEGMCDELKKLLDRLERIRPQRKRESKPSTRQTLIDKSCYEKVLKLS